MNKVCTVLLSVVCLVLLSSCHKQAECIFGTIPSNYDNEMIGVTKKAQQMSHNPGELMSMIKEMADSAFYAAGEKSQDEVKKLKGMTVNYTIDPDLDLRISSDIKIEDINLPELSRASTCVTLSFDATTKDKQLNYILEGDGTMIGYGTFAMSNSTGEKQHVEMDVNSPNVPALYQEKCKTIRFVTSETLSKALNTIQPNQIQWQKEYREQMKM